METTPSKSCSSYAGWRLPALLVLVLAAIVLLRLFGNSISSTSVVEDSKREAADVSAREHVSLTVDFGNGQRREFDTVAWHEGMTVADLMRSASDDLQTTQKGSGQGALLTAIGDVANEGPSGSNWTYEVNGQSADRSLAVYELHPGDRVLWTFGPQR